MHRFHSANGTVVRLGQNSTHSPAAYQHLGCRGGEGFIAWVHSRSSGPTEISEVQVRISLLAPGGAHRANVGKAEVLSKCDQQPVLQALRSPDLMPRICCLDTLVDVMLCHEHVFLLAMQAKG